jgi:hypothetical protein
MILYLTYSNPNDYIVRTHQCFNRFELSELHCIFPLYWAARQMVAIKIRCP